ncbi:MAG: hypothetical protein KGH61_03285 [Candidatus Micrarchaeota archaeon]|nr:hypothetical protein [Candidatus Micrarchaeota archaeon]MDE1847947.1 hypothetical protein [Candidatus Micrarchaeota archaeon]MDE1864336.1 hypothetical protein [Candidatus Micrarchaeota archaeon]
MSGKGDQIKAQFAFIESLISLVLVITSLYYISMGISNAVSAWYSGKQELSANVAIYDFSYETAQNSSMNSCISSIFSTPNQSCINHYISEYKKIYGINLLELKAPRAAFGDQVKHGVTGCLAFSESNSIEPLCIIIGV